ncbi:MAG TPA: hypothetical protein VE685_19170 [Thermoanaerobaculia bacterium]|nr:hypothetical protein [Thermoanaerobaculia bacterium]
MSRHMDLVQRLKDSVLRGRGATAPALRQAAAARAAEVAGLPPGEAAGEIPADLWSYVETIGRHAYRITEEDIAALRQAGWSEDEIFEVSISAAVGAGMSRLERGLAALRGGTR